MTLQIFKNGQMISTITKHKKTQFRRAIKVVSFTEQGIKAFIRVSYGKGCNESDHFNEKSLRNALDSYTEKKLIDFILQK